MFLRRLAWRNRTSPFCPSVAVPGLKCKEIAEFGEYRTQRRVLEAFDQLNGVIKRQ